MLILWTLADTHTLKQVINPIVSKYIIEHRVDDNKESLPSLNRGDVLLAFGLQPLALLQKLGVIPKGRTITSTLGHCFIYLGIPVFITFDPSIVSIDYGRLYDIRWAVQLAIRYINTGTTEPVLGTYIFTESLHRIIQKVVSEDKKPVPLAVDLETMGLDCYNQKAQIISISFTVKSGESEVVYFEQGEKPDKPPINKHPDNYNYWERLYIQLNWLLTDKRIVVRGANFKFDSHWLYEKWGILCTNQLFDTQLVGSLLQENRSNSLKLHAKIYTPYGNYEQALDKYDIAKAELIPRDILMKYNAQDTIATYDVAECMRGELLSDKKLTNFYVQLVQPAANIFEKMERTGVCVDVPYYNQLKDEIQAETSRLHHEMLELIPIPLQTKYQANLSVTRAVILKDLFFTKEGFNLKPKMVTTKTGEPSTAISHLLMFEKNKKANEFVTLLKQYTSGNKILNTYVTGFLKHLKPDNKFHPTYFIGRGDYGGKSDSAAVTGRVSASNPAIQTLPKRGDYAHRLRRAFVAPEGHVILSADFGQGELKIASCVAQEEVMINAFKEGKDLHAITAAKLSGYTFEDFMTLPAEERELLRYKAKAAGFGLCIAQNQSILTQYGIIPIQDVQLDHKLWDGVEWVSHDGVLDKGWKEVITWDGITATPDHEVWTEDGRKIELQQAAKEGSKLARTATVFGEPIIWEPNISSGGNNYRLLTHCSNAMLGLWKVTGYLWERFISWTHAELCMPQNGEVRERPKSTSFGGKIRRYDSALQSGYTQSQPTLQRQGNKMFICFQRAFYSMGFRDFPHRIIQGVGVRQVAQQEGALSSRQFTASNKYCESPQYGLQCNVNVPRKRSVLDGLAQSLCSKENTTLCFAGINRGADNRTSQTVHTKQVQELERVGIKVERARVYDILNAGSRRRFTCEGRLVSNCYGMGHKGFQTYAKASYGIDMTEEEALQARNVFFELFPRLLEWHEECKNIARMYGSIRSPLGRIRHLPLINSKDKGARAQAERQAVNSCIQATLSDLCQLAMIELDKLYGEQLHIFLMCHDSLSFYLKSGEELEWAKRVKFSMEGLPITELFGWKPPITFTVDCEISVPDEDGVHSLANMLKIKDLH